MAAMCAPLPRKARAVPPTYQPEVAARSIYNAVPGNFGAHGSLNRRARSASLELWAETHAKWLAVTAGLGLAAAAFKLLRRSRVSSGNNSNDKERFEPEAA
jgi:hypothetical protein